MSNENAIVVFALLALAAVCLNFLASLIVVTVTIWRATKRVLRLVTAPIRWLL